MGKYITDYGDTACMGTLDSIFFAMNGNVLKYDVTN